MMYVCLRDLQISHARLARALGVCGFSLLRFWTFNFTFFVKNNLPKAAVKDSGYWYHIVALDL